MKFQEPPQEKPIRILCVDDHPLLRAGIAGVIENEPDLLIVAEAASGPEAIEQYRLHQPDVTLMDIQMPGMTGVEATIEIRKEFPAAKIVMLTTYKNDLHVVRAIKAGAIGYMLKNMLRTELSATIRLAYAGRRQMPATAAKGIDDCVTYGTLTSREIEVLKLAANGKSNKLIGAALAISEETVKVHMKSILSKMMANDRTHAVSLAYARGIITVNDSDPF